MDLVLAAGGKGSRMTAAGLDLPKPLIPDPITGKPLILHKIERLQVAFPLEKIILVGSEDTDTAQRTYEFLKNAEISNKPEIILSIGKRRGVIDAFNRGLQTCLDLKREDLLLSVSDTVAKTYEPFCDEEPGILIGVSKPNPQDTKKYKYVYLNKEKEFSFDSQNNKEYEPFVIAGIYRLRGSAVTDLHLGFTSVLVKKNSEAKLQDSFEEPSITATLSALSKQHRLAFKDLEGFTEVNFPEDLAKFRRIVE